MFLIGQVEAIIDSLNNESNCKKTIYLKNSMELNTTLFDKGESNMSLNSYNGIKILQRTDGRYYACKQENGIRNFIYGKTKQELYDKLKELYPIKQKKQIQPMTFYEFWDYWYNKYKKPTIKENTLKNYRSVFKNQIQPNFKDKPIRQISVAELNELINKIEYGRMKEYLSQFLRDCFKMAYRENKIKYDIWEEIIKYHHTRQEGTALTKQQRQILLQNTRKIKHGDIFEFYLFSGARPSEALNFKPKDIEEEFIHLEGTKTEHSDRWIPKFKKLDEILKRQDLTHETVFNISEATRKRELKALTKLCGFNFKTKDLRTTFATMLAENGLSDKIIAKWMGHSNTSTTNKYYIKVLTQYEKEQKQQIENAIYNTFDNTINSK